MPVADDSDWRFPIDKVARTPLGTTRTENKIEPVLPWTLPFKHVLCSKQAAGWRYFHLFLFSCPLFTCNFCFAHCFVQFKIDFGKTREFWILKFFFDFIFSPANQIECLWVFIGDSAANQLTAHQIAAVFMALFEPGVPPWPQQYGNQLAIENQANNPLVNWTVHWLPKKSLNIDSSIEVGVDLNTDCVEFWALYQWDVLVGDWLLVCRLKI